MCVYACMHACMYVCMYACMHVCMCRMYGMYGMYEYRHTQRHIACTRVTIVINSLSVFCPLPGVQNQWVKFLVSWRHGPVI